MRRVGRRGDGVGVQAAQQEQRDRRVERVETPAQAAHQHHGERGPGDEDCGGRQRLAAHRQATEVSRGLDDEAAEALADGAGCHRKKVHGPE